MIYRRTAVVSSSTRELIIGTASIRVLTTARELPELTLPDIINNGIIMTGGGSQLAGLDLILSDVTGIRAKVAKDPVSCVAIGTGKSLSKLSYAEDDDESASLS